MSPIRPLIGLLAVSAFAAGPSLDALLKGVEGRYNAAKTLQVLFHEEYTPPARPRRVESGSLFLRKPGRMRWEYAQPKGKLFVSDGKNLWLYTPAENRVEKMALKESDDMRAPLAFLLGKLNFQKEFRDIQAAPEGGGTRIAAQPRTETLPYSQVEFVVTPEHVIREVKVVGFDKSLLDFTFDQERMNPALNPKMFQFIMPAGAELVEGAQ